MRIGLLTEGGHPYVSGDARLRCDRLVRGVRQHEYEIYALSRSERQEDEGWIELPPHVSRARTAPLRTVDDDGVVHGRAVRKRFTEAYGELAAVICSHAPHLAPEESSTPEADRFGSALYALAELARDEGGLIGALRSESAVHALERACRAPSAGRAAHEARVPDLLTVAAHLERAPRPLSLDRYGDDDLGSVDLCHTTAGGAAALPGLLAHRPPRRRRRLPALGTRPAGTGTAPALSTASAQALTAARATPARTGAGPVASAHAAQPPAAQSRAAQSRAAQSRVPRPGGASGRGRGPTHAWATGAAAVPGAVACARGAEGVGATTSEAAR